MYFQSPFCMTIQKNVLSYKTKILRKKFCMTIEKNLDRNQKLDLTILYDKRKKP